jgi:hypothetical protein
MGGVRQGCVKKWEKRSSICGKVEGGKTNRGDGVRDVSVRRGGGGKRGKRAQRVPDRVRKGGLGQGCQQAMNTVENIC